jgi:putative ABC transport system ATP-binding protein
LHDDPAKAAACLSRVLVINPDNTEAQAALFELRMKAGGEVLARPSEPAPDEAPVVAVSHLRRLYQVGGQSVRAVDGVTMDIWPGRMTAVIGRSGSGKTTFLNLIAGLDQPTEGEILIDGTDLVQMSENDRLRLRRDRLGFVFQTFGLIPLLSARENIEVPLRMRHVPRTQREKKSSELLEWVGLADRARHRPYELSGGEQQRVAIARALANAPQLVLADEPPGQLDTQTGGQIRSLLRRLVDEQGITILIVSHDPAVRMDADVVHELRDGKLVSTTWRTRREEEAAAAAPA